MKLKIKQGDIFHMNNIIGEIFEDSYGWTAICYTNDIGYGGIDNIFEAKQHIIELFNDALKTKSTLNETIFLKEGF